MSVYKNLGLTFLINALGYYAAVGGSQMSEKTLADMVEAARYFIDIRSLQKKVNERLAQITNNEAAAGIYICCAACISILYKKNYNYLSKKDIEFSEFIVCRAHRNPYDWGLRLMGIGIKKLGFPNIIQMATAEELEATINEKTAAIFYAYSVPNGWIADGQLGLEDTIRIAKKYNIPVLVDAASQLPKKENLWIFTRDMRADACLFSGGKDLRCPQSSGLIVGKKVFLDQFAIHNFPNYGPGRMLKTGREEIIGLLSAVEQYIFHDESKRKEYCENEVAKLIEYGNTSLLYNITRSFPNEAEQPIPRAEITLKKNIMFLQEMVNCLLSSEISIYTVLERGKLFINPICLEEGETEIIIQQLKKNRK